jgi:hypothetical protein
MKRVNGMNLRTLLRYMMLINMLLATAVGHCADPPRLTIGILPTFNADTENFGPVFSQHLTLKLFEHLQNQAVRTVLLNPGGLYNPTDDDWLLDYGKKGAADFLVITTLLKTQTPEKGDYTITVHTEILDLKTGSRAGLWQNTVKISRHDAQLDYGRLHMFGDYYLGPSRVFEKQPLGKAMLAMADQVSSQVLPAISEKTAVSGGVQTQNKASGPCDVLVKLLYTSKHAASKSYTMFVDGEEESLGVKEGVLPLRQKSGDLLLQWSVNDAPYKLPTQRLYQAGTEVDCSKPERQLNIEIGAAGEALLVWR